MLVFNVIGNQRLRDVSAACILCLGAFGISGAAFAQNAPQPEKTALLSEVVVTGSRGERDVKEVPASVELVGKEELEKRQVSDIRELAETLPNVSVERRSNRMGLTGTDGRAGNAGFNIRGLDGNRVLMLIDGTRLPRSYSFGASGRDNLDMGLIERVEIIKGPSSSLYGSDGIGGVVQFLTPEPRDLLKNTRSFAGRANLGFDSASRLFKSNATLAGKFNKDTGLSWLLSFGANSGHELKTRGDNDSLGALRTKANPEKSRSNAVLGKLVFEPSSVQKHVFSFEHVQKKSDIDILSQYGVASRGITVLTANGGVNNKRSRISWQGTVNAGLSFADTIRTNISWQRLNSLEHFENTRQNVPSQVRDTLNHETILQSSVQLEKVLNAGSIAHKLTYGVDAVSTKADTLLTGQTPPAGETFPTKRFPDTNEKLLGLFLQNEMIANGWSVIGGIRFDKYKIRSSQSGFAGENVNKSGSAISPRIGATFDINENWSTFAQYATGFRTPSADQLNRFFENPIGFYQTIPNANLRPEKAKNLELGIKGAGQDWKMQASVFQGRYKDFIEDNQVVSGTGRPGDPLVFQAINIGRAKITGFEIAGQYSFKAPNLGGKITTTAAFGMARGKNSQTGAPINSILPARLNLGAHYEREDWSAGLDITHRAGKKAKDVAVSSDPRAGGTPFLPKSSTVLNLRGQWKIYKKGDTQIRLNASIENLTNKKYWRYSDVIGLSASLASIDAYSQAPRSFAVNLNIDF